LVRGLRERRQRASPLTWLALWFLLTFVVFSIIPVKRALYLMPIYPAAALLAAGELAYLARMRAHSRWISMPAPLLLGLAGAAALALAPWHAELEGLRVGVGCIGALLLVGALLAWRQRAQLQSQASVLALSVALSVLVGALWIVPQLNPVKSARVLAQYLAERPEKPTRISCLGVQPEGYRFYAKIPASKEDFEPALQREGAQFLGLARESDYEKLPAALRERLSVLHRAQVGSRELVVVGAKLP
jgi:4-amino-4-deoxy-L-arabinose transferase-like glycosyltransferase